MFCFALFRMTDVNKCSELHTLLLWKDAFPEFWFGSSLIYDCNLRNLIVTKFSDSWESSLFGHFNRPNVPKSLEPRSFLLYAFTCWRVCVAACVSGTDGLTGQSLIRGNCSTPHCAHKHSACVHLLGMNMCTVTPLINYFSGIKFWIFFLVLFFWYLYSAALNLKPLKIKFEGNQMLKVVYTIYWRTRLLKKHPKLGTFHYQDVLRATVDEKRNESISSQKTFSRKRFSEFDYI